MSEAIGPNIDAIGIIVKPLVGHYDYGLTDSSRPSAARPKSAGACCMAAIGLATVKRIEAAPDIRGAADTLLEDSDSS